MESTCKPGMVHVSQATWEALGPPDLEADPHWCVWASRYHAPAVVYDYKGRLAVPEPVGKQIWEP